MFKFDIKMSIKVRQMRNLKGYKIYLPISLWYQKIKWLMIDDEKVIKKFSV